MNKQDVFFMQHAIMLAKKAKQQEEVPVGALLVENQEIISEGWNKTIQLLDPTAHAEIIAIRNASKQIGNYRLLNLTLYVTLEPCMMCVGAIIQARIKRVVFGALDPKTGAISSKIKTFEHYPMNHIPLITEGVLQQECSQQLNSFFLERRQNNKKIIIPN